MNSNVGKIPSEIWNKKHPDMIMLKSATDYYWAIFSIFLFCAIVYPIVSIFSSPPKRMFYYVYSVTCMVSAIVYFSMAGELGYTLVNLSTSTWFRGIRVVYFVRYIQWMINFPLVISSIFHFAGVSFMRILLTVFNIWLCFSCLLAAAMTVSTHRWGFFAFSLVGYACALVHTCVTYKFNIQPLKRKAKIGFLCSIIYFFVLWASYFVCWGLCEGIGFPLPIGEAVFYSVLDFLEFPIFGVLFSWMIDVVGLHRFSKTYLRSFLSDNPEAIKLDVISETESPKEKDEPEAQYTDS
ncbi:membrane transporter [Schizosaccharomyces octosporus yFS286]|uniref:Membrane transporter n=1 Tax=Schizosaccharomyces octosporus (strain yFS286) TaxID=483514 RepID=S9R0D2_SCHOY|nr:membrane transporter [Schizosaccharomyces octosporus yFS286]EPX71935.1 membrane transporter [Schizosaccharomyces octosporus yFS286]